MAQKKKKNRKKSKPTTKTGSKPKPSMAAKPAVKTNPSPYTPLFWGGLVLIGLAIASSLMLTLENLMAIGLPGCGEGSGCAEAADSDWGRVPIVNWPLSSVGLAYFTSLLVVFIVEKGRLPGLLRMLVRLSTLGSVILITVMFTNGYICKYCMLVHGANLGFWFITECIAPRRDHLPRALGTLAGVFLIGILTLVVLENRKFDQTARAAELDRESSTQEILQASNSQRHNFTGRYHYGSADSPLHIVMFTDFQCPDCQRIEGQIERIFDERTNVSLSTKHFPFCTECNPKITSNLHPNACNAARAAEAAGIMGGNNAYWSTHFWLFSVDGVFDERQLRGHAQRMGFDYDQYATLMESAQVDELIKADIDEAVGLGLHYTPMIFINGVQLRGVASHDVLYRTVADLTSKNPEAVYDVIPATAREKHIEDWRAKPIYPMQPEIAEHVLGPDQTTVNIVVWGDYMGGATATVDQAIRSLRERREDVRYTFRHFPVNPKCNSNVPITSHELSCEASMAVEAAGLIGGEDAYWKMHLWVLENQENFTLDSIDRGALAIGLNPQELRLMMQSAKVNMALQEDIATGASFRLRSVPALFINGRIVPRIFFGDDCLVDDIASDILGVDVTEN